jgi:hypothetical protein
MELLSNLLSLLPLNDLGRLGLVSYECRRLMCDYLADEMYILHVGRSLRDWSDTRVISLLRATPKLSSLTIDGSFGFGSVRRALELPCAQALSSLSLRGYSGEAAARLSTAALGALPHLAPNLQTLSLISCDGLSDRLALGFAGLRRLRSISLPKNPQLSEGCLQHLLKASKSIEDADFSGCGQMLSHERGTRVSKRLAWQQAQEEAADQRARAGYQRARAGYQRAGSKGAKGGRAGSRGRRAGSSGGRAGRHSADGGIAGCCSFGGGSSDSVWPDSVDSGEACELLESNQGGGALGGLGLGLSGGSGLGLGLGSFCSLEDLGPAVPPGCPGWDRLRVGSLCLRSWKTLTSLTLDDAPQLTLLDLSSCGALTELRLALPRLCSLNSANCASLGGLRLECVELRTLVLSQCKALVTLEADQTERLETLNLFGCRSLGADVLNSLLSRCGLSLRTLDLNGTLRTTELTEGQIRERCPSLAHLDVRGRQAKY